MTTVSREIADTKYKVEEGERMRQNSIEKEATLKDAMAAVDSKEEPWTSKPVSPPMDFRPPAARKETDAKDLVDQVSKNDEKILAEAKNSRVQLLGKVDEQNTVIAVARSRIADYQRQIRDIDSLINSREEAINILVAKS